jgi:hypothetical protein
VSASLPRSVLDDQAEKTRNARIAAELERANASLDALQMWLELEENGGATVVRIEEVRDLLTEHMNGGA